jgi:hypothetical protein
MAMWRTGIDDQQCDIGGIGIEWHRLGGCLAEVDRQRRMWLAEQRCQMIEQTRWRPDVFVLRALCDSRLLDLTEAKPAGSSDRTLKRRAVQGRRRRQPGTDLDAILDLHRAPGNVVSRLAKRPDHTRNIGALRTGR